MSKYEIAKEIYNLFLENNLIWLFWTFLVLWLISYIIVWIISRFKTISETRKNDIEIRGKRILHQKELFEFHDKIQASTIKANNKLRNLCDSLENADKISSKSNWVEASYSFFDETSMNYKNYLDIAKIVYKNERKETKRIIQDSVFHYLRLAIDFKDTLGNVNILSFCNEAEFIISSETLKPFYRFVTDNTTIFNYKIRNKYREYKKELDTIQKS